MIRYEGPLATVWLDREPPLTGPYDAYARIQQLDKPPQPSEAHYITGIERVIESLILPCHPDLAAHPPQRTIRGKGSNHPVMILGKRGKEGSVEAWHCLPNPNQSLIDSVSKEIGPGSFWVLNLDSHRRCLPIDWDLAGLGQVAELPSEFPVELSVNQRGEIYANPHYLESIA